MGDDIDNGAADRAYDDDRQRKLDDRGVPPYCLSATGKAIDGTMRYTVVTSDHKTIVYSSERRAAAEYKLQELNRRWGK